MWKYDQARVEKARVERKMTRAEAARRAGITTPQQICDIERRPGANPTILTLERVANGLGCSPAEFFEEVDDGVEDGQAQA